MDLKNSQHSDRRFNSITNSPDVERENKLISKPEMVRAELQFDFYDTNHKQVINNKDEHDNSLKLEQCCKENKMVRAELQCEDPFCFNDYELGNFERNSNDVKRMPDEMGVHSENTKERCPKPASLNYMDLDFSASSNFSRRVSRDSFADVSSNNDFVGIPKDDSHIKVCTRTVYLEAENIHVISLHEHKKKSEENEESSSGMRKDHSPVSNSEENSVLKGSQRGNEVELKSRKQKQTNRNPSIATDLSESFLTSSSVSHPQQPTVDAEDKEYKNPGNLFMIKSMPKHPDYVPLQSQINSFAGWPTYLDQTPQMMAEAGFYYSGINDYTRCFHCGGGLRNCEPGDNPWIEHARWYPECAYVLDKKGHKFVNAVLNKVKQLAINNPWRSESSSMTNISTIRRPGTASNLEFDSSQESGSQSGQQETTTEPELLLPDKERGSRPWRQSNSATMEESTEMRRLCTTSEDNNPLPIPTGIPLSTITESNQSSGHPQLEGTSLSLHRRLNISNPLQSAVNMTLSCPSFGNHGASQDTKTAKSPSSLPQL